MREIVWTAEDFLALKGDCLAWSYREFVDKKVVNKIHKFM